LTPFRFFSGVVFGDFLIDCSIILPLLLLSDGSPENASSKNQ
jgi:hypothetical protein